MDENQKEEKIFKKLKDWRKKIAEENNLPEFRVLQNRTLKQISIEKPKTIDELRNVWGIGENRIRKYGYVLINLVHENTGTHSEKAIKKTIISDKENALTVSQVNEYIKGKICDDPNLNQIYVRGEITNRSESPSGHIYFDIKDKNALLKCVFFGDKNKDLSFDIENGLDALIFGSIKIYEKKSTYQLNADSISPVGKGEFILKFEQLKEKLSKDGLFDEKHKKEISYLYKSLGLITSKESSAYEDVIKVLKNRFPVNIKLVSVATQGENAPTDIIRAINVLNQIGKVEEIGVILIVRGGGPTEDLACFNDEDLARAIFNSKIPIITGVGHETDYTIADFTADKRAATPSIAAKIAVPDKNELLEKIELKRKGLKKSYENFIKSGQKDKALTKKGKEISEKEKQLKKYKNAIIGILVIFIIILLVVLYFLIKMLMSN